MKTIQDFVEKYFPNYYSSPEIALNNDLQKILDGELNGWALEIFINECSEWGIPADEQSDVESSDYYAPMNEIRKRKAESDVKIYESSIKQYLNS